VPTDDAGPRQPVARPTMRSLLRRPGYRRLWLARTLSQWGDVVQVVALGLLVFELTGTGLGVSGLVIAEIAPVLLLAPLAGTLVDRLPRVRVMVAADLTRLVLAALLVVAQHNVVAVYAIAFGLSAAGVFFNPAAASALPALVDDDELVTANSGIWTAAVLSQIVLAPLAGLLAAAAGFAPAFLVNAASFGASALALRGLTLAHPPASIGGRQWLADARVGAAHLLGDGLLRALAAAQLLAALSAGATSALLVVLARDHLHTGRQGYGMLLGAIGAGAAAGPWLLVRILRQPRRHEVVFGAFALRGAVDLVLATVRSLPAAAGALAAYGLGTSTGTVTFNALLQAHVPDELRGRVFASFDLLWQTGRLASIALGGLAADRLGIRAVYYLAGLLLLAAALSGTTIGRTHPDTTAGRA
jgi:MFS family permease